MSFTTQNGAHEKAAEVTPHKESSSSNHFKDAFYSDCFARYFIGNPYHTVQSVYLEMSSKAPRWVNSLLALRDRIVVPFGMSPTHGFNAHQKQTELLKCGDTLDFFKISAIKQNELELKLSDIHFTVSISVYLHQDITAQRIYVTSIVNAHTWQGKVYVSIIAPFHRLVVRSMLNRLG